MLTAFLGILRNIKLWHQARPHVAIYGLTTCIVVLLSYVVFLAPPQQFPEDTIFTVPSGSSLAEIATTLKENGYIHYPVVFKILVKGVLGGERRLVAGDYQFETPLNTFTIASRIMTGHFDLVPAKITIPEGLNKFEIADLLEKKIAHFDKETFTEIAPEGYLFPDTYYISRVATPEQVVELMTENFWKKIAEIDEDIQASGRSLVEIVSVASIVELEARKFETRKIVADVLWRRLDKNMPLQVDVSFKYINGKPTSELTQIDLDSDSPYNSYKFKGLPPTPLANPGLESLIATIKPTPTKYLFFLSDKNGVMHYATTFDQHKENKEKYIY